jgi:tetratricopeptide (TPR) repeat protein
MIDPTDLWDYDDPAGSEARFRVALDTAEGTDRLVLLTQVARALGLQDRFDEGHAVIDDLATFDPEVATRVELERGRLLRSSGAPDEARPHFEAAAGSASAAGLEALNLDALHMVALVADPADQVALHEQALAVARAATDPRARNWDAALLNNLGMTYTDAGDWDRALATFEEALAACERIGDPARIRIARWMIGWTLRNLGRTDEALTLQRALHEEFVGLGLSDPYVDEELALLES